MRKFKIPSIPPTTNKCIRIPNDVIAGVEKAIRGRDCTFSAFVIEALRVALENLEEENGEHPDPKDFNLPVKLIVRGSTGPARIS